MKEFIKKIPILGDVASTINYQLRKRFFPGSKNYWEERYSRGGNSGLGSYGKFAEFKADLINSFVATHSVKSVIEFGCGDGNQLTLANYPKYIGFDVSETAVSKCQELFAEDNTKSFKLMQDYCDEKAELALSLDVIYHLVEDRVFENYMRTLFGAGVRYVIIYSSDFDNNEEVNGTHVKHRKFTTWVETNLQHRLIKHIPNKYPYQDDYRQGSFADFFIYEKV